VSSLQNSHYKEYQLNFEKIYVLDTNIILEDANQLITIGQSGKNLIILPETVIDELDAKKSGFSEINFQAREFGRILSEAEVIKTRKSGAKKDVTIMSLRVKDIFIDIISFKDYGLQGVDPSVINDRKIIKAAEFATTFYKMPSETVLLSNDIMCRTRAVSLNVQAEGLTRNKDSLKNEFVKVLHLDDIDSLRMDGAPILRYDSEHKPENYCYHFIASDGHERIGYIIDGCINFIDDEDFHGLAVKPLNLGQRFAMAGMCDERVDVCVIEALAGSGKTLLAIAAGMKMVRMGKYDKIIYIRNSVESVDKAEEVGFLPGLEEKFKIYNYPLYDTLEFIAQKELKKSDKPDRHDKSEKADKHDKSEKADNNKSNSIEDKIQELTQRYNIETMWNGSIRGRTISRSFVIVDEVQNFAKTSLQTVLTRMDKESKVVCIGSNRQIDHPYINKYTNGLSTLIKAAKEENEEINIFGTELNKVVRGKITEWTERIFENK
jgi:PhoH-like ATPase